VQSSGRVTDWLVNYSWLVRWLRLSWRRGQHRAVLTCHMVPHEFCIGVHLALRCSMMCTQAWSPSPLCTGSAWRGRTGWSPLPPWRKCLCRCTCTTLYGKKVMHAIDKLMHVINFITVGLRIKCSLSSFISFKFYSRTNRWRHFNLVSELRS
jgi:hypothetical protein